MSLIRQRLALLLASLLVAAALSSCTEGSLGRLKHVRTGAIGIGPTGDLPGDRTLAHLKPESPEELRVQQAVRRGVEHALGESRAFDYVPFARMQQVPPHLTPFNERAAVKKFAATNHLAAVVRVWATPDFASQSVSVGILIHNRGGRAFASSLAEAPGPVPPLKNATSRTALSAWEKTAFEAARKALTKVRG